MLMLEDDQGEIYVLGTSDNVTNVTLFTYYYLLIVISGLNTTYHNVKL